MVDAAVAVGYLNVVELPPVPHPVVVGQAFVCLIAVVEIVTVDVLHIADLEHLCIVGPFAVIIPSGARCKIRGEWILTCIATRTRRQVTGSSVFLHNR